VLFYVYSKSLPLWIDKEPSWLELELSVPIELNKEDFNPQEDSSLMFQLHIHQLISLLAHNLDQPIQQEARTINLNILLFEEGS
jgi:hypothetical protein